MTDAVRLSVPAPALTRPDNDARLRALSQQLEAGFLAEMLGHAGFGTARESFGGGAGEEQFASFLRQEQANAMVKAGGIGLAESLFNAMTGGRDAQHGK
jgi:Rod binding domain-containing protein